MPSLSAPTPLCCLGKAQSQLSQVLQVARGKGRPSSYPCLQASSLVSGPPAPALLSFPGEVQGQLSQMLQLGKNRASSSALVTPGRTLPTPATGEGLGQGDPLHPGHLAIGVSFPTFPPSGLFIHTPAISASSTVLLQRASVSEGQGQSLDIPAQSLDIHMVPDSFPQPGMFPCFLVVI